MIVRAFIVDDEPPARSRLRQLLADAGGVLVVGEAGDALEARDGIAEARPDLVFLDIEMPETSGTALAASLPEPRPFVVFATAYDRYALDAFAVDATDYLVKPITRARLAATLNRVRERLSRRSDLERDLAAASAAQAMLLGRQLPVIHGFDSAAVTLPARGVGGDFFLSVPIAPGRYALALGDVSGKGMPAGLIASSVQARIEAVARHADATAAEVVGDVNRAVCATSADGRYATLAYVELDAVTSQLTIVNAGHLPVIIARTASDVELVPSSGPAIGFLPDARFGSHSVILERGMLVVYSDGVTEAAADDGTEFEMARLQCVLGEHAASSAAEVCRAVVDAVRRHAGNRPPADDVTVMVIRRMEAEPSAPPATTI